jgi:hypothetical protein
MKLTILLFFSFLIGYSQTEKSQVTPFLSDIVSQFPNVRDVAISATQDEVVFSAQSYMSDISALVAVKKTEIGWSKPEIVAFSGQYFDLEPYFSEDGLSLYFVSNRPLDASSTEAKDFDIWYVTRTSKNAEWSEPVNVGMPINTSMDEFYPIITRSKNIYFTLDNPELKQKDNIYISEFKNGVYTTPKSVETGVNSEGYEFNAYVSLDESVMIYTCYNKQGGFGSGDLYISHKDENGEWITSENMGELINGDKMDYCPFVDMTTKTLYFTSKRNAIAPDFKTKSTTKDLMTTFESYENGLSRLYQVDISGLLEKN